ncbi:hypothetical protein B0H21DRAFT_862019 [Amylocystis lapponica]|nr:hypothetical protein B0H21DRAFT_862019 [Amylocystis lapponica]
MRSSNLAQVATPHSFALDGVVPFLQHELAYRRLAAAVTAPGSSTSLHSLFSSLVDPTINHDMSTAKTYGTAPVAPRRTVSSADNVILYFFALIIPPATVFVKRGLRADFWINFLLWMFGWIPGVIHAWWIISHSEGDI